MARALPERRFVATAAAALVAAALVASALVLRSGAGDRAALLCSIVAPRWRSPSDGVSASYAAASAAAAAELSAALVHYATSSVVPQQSRAEIGVSLAVLRRRAPCNLLVFGVGHDSLLWSALNPGGATLFLEEDPKWLRSALAAAPSLRARLARYPTRLDDADALLASLRSDPSPCADLDPRGRRCPLALPDLPAEAYAREWDAIMIDAPRGYFAAAPGRMGAIYTAAAMAWARSGEGDTDVFLHDVDRRVERAYALEFLCEKYRVGGAGRLWHFRIPPASRRPNATTDAPRGFCAH
ncbi:probable methyltransferase At1g27930 [Ananas comosus]|uniref:Glucuronoxylan 4-O-methyltransferase 1 n=1 Tax=Ananas comosus TaxID=4615 RepID=A0A199UJJ9_ANACO|nr:probable methyltransferase At1g27930 [Ananas comosus]OAY64881.1 Glucuronoxylan 4-O-methyltransferase 1 [Ananas comosus]